MSDPSDPADPFDPSDPFDTATLRAAALESWRRSPTRFTEDANAEEDLRLGAYADRLFVELAQNAADAASLAGVPGRMRLSRVGNELRVANTGTALDRAGVAALASLRASAKQGEGTVGRFGVGFAAVLTVCTEPRVISRSGGVVFSEQNTRDSVAGIPGVRAQFERRGEAVPVLRLPWPAAKDEPEVPAGFDTEVRLPLAEGIDGSALLTEIVEEIEDVLLTFAVLEHIDVAATVWSRSTTTVGSDDGTEHRAEGDIVEIYRAGERTGRWLVHSSSGEFDAEQASMLGIEAAKNPQWTVLWALPVDDACVPQPVVQDVLHAPTATDERLSVPARLVASVPVEPSRRRVRRGPALSAVLHAAARSYRELVAQVHTDHRIGLVPAKGFPLSDVDDSLREMIIEQLRERPWLPAAAGGELAGFRAQVLDVDSAELAHLFGEVFPDLVAAPYVGSNVVGVLASVGARPLTVAGALDELIGLERAAGWWRALYDALAVLLDARAVDQDTLTGLVVPLADGRTTPGVRGVLLPEGETELLELVTTADIAGIRVARPDVVHPLLERVGAKHGDAAELLDLEELRAAVERSVADATTGMDTGPLAELVLRLVTETGASQDAGRAWLTFLALPTGDGDVRQADELILPRSPLREVFAYDAIGSDGPVAVAAAELVRRWPPEALTAVGVLESFTVVRDADPAGPDHDLPDEQEWWDSLEHPPAQMLAVRDLDLVADDAWPQALRLLADRQETWHALTERGGHTGWWVARFARLAGEAPRHWRLPSCVELAELYDPVPETGLSPDLLAAAGVRARLALHDASDADDLLDRLADAHREPRPGVILRAHDALADLATVPGFDLTQVTAPSAVRALDGRVCAGEQACVLDQPWLLDVADAAKVVGCTRACTELAELLDLPLTSEVYGGRVLTDGDTFAWSDLSAARGVADLLGVAVPDGAVCLHAELAIGLQDARLAARWWVDAEGSIHADDSVEGLARALAYAIGRWDTRHLITALFVDPTAGTLLG